MYVPGQLIAPLFNLWLVLRKLCEICKPRALQGAVSALHELLMHAWTALEAFRGRLWGLRIRLRLAARPSRRTASGRVWPVAID